MIQFHLVGWGKARAAAAAHTPPRAHPVALTHTYATTAVLCISARHISKFTIPRHLPSPARQERINKVIAMPTTDFSLGAKERPAA